MGTKVVMPQLGESVVEGTVGQWLKDEGETVEEFEPLLEVITDKVDTEVSAPASGTLLKIFISEGETVAAGTLLAFIGQSGEDLPVAEVPTVAHPAASTDGARQVAAPAPIQTSTGDGGGGPHVTPVVARIAAEYGIDVRQVPGTGRGGRVTKKDILAFIEGGAAPAATDLPPWETPGSGDLFKPTGEIFEAATQVPAPAASAASARSAGQPGELVPLTNIRRRIAEHMVQSKLHTSPHVTTVFEVDMSSVASHRAANKDSFARQGTKLTYTAYLVAASASALRAYPLVNSQWTDEGILLKPEVNVGVAAATDQGLIVPVVKEVDSLSLLGVARTINDLAERARAGQLKPDDIVGGTFTITNHGVSGSLFATPIINQPQTAILGVGIIQKRPVVVTDPSGGDALAIRRMMYVGLTFDHRVLDGAVADTFLAHLKEALETWQ